MSAHVPPPYWVDPLATADRDRQRQAEREALARDLGALAARSRRAGYDRVGAMLGTLARSVEEGCPA